jgi:hypothetical protein
MKQSFRVIKPYQTPFSDPLIARKGERLSFERRESEWEGWIWCTCTSGRSGWVPENWVQIKDRYCVLQRDYTAAELSVGNGETITADILESGWAWATKESGDSGWIPLKHLSPDPGSGTPYQLSDGDQARMLRKLMLYWDGQWFLKTVEVFGLEAAIDLNARVRASFGRIEMRLLLKTLGRSKADDLADALHLLQTYAETFMGTRLRAEFFVQGSDQAEVIVRRCAAYEGAKRAALPRADQACIACETLWDAWLETLMPDRQVEIQYPVRQGKGDSICRFLIQLDVEEKDVQEPKLFSNECSHTCV